VARRAGGYVVNLQAEGAARRATADDAAHADDPSRLPPMRWPSIQVGDNPEFFAS